MAVYNSVNVCTEYKGFQALYSHDIGSEQVIIKDSLISDENVALARAKSELLRGGYTERVVNITTVFTPSLRQNDIISFNGSNWLVKEITLSFNPPKLLQTIKGVRYE